MRRLACAVGMALLVAAPAIAQAPDPQFLISLGAGIGPLRIGMSITDAVAVLGTPKVTRQMPSGVLYTWYDLTEFENGTTQRMPSVDPNAGGGLDVTCTPAGRIEAVSAFYAPQYVTGNGLHTGVRESDVRAAMGEPSKIVTSEDWHFLRYASKGVTFRVLDRRGLNGSGTVYLITVFAPQ